MRAEPSGHSWIVFGQQARVAASIGGAVQCFRASAPLVVGQDAEIAPDMSVSPLGTVVGATPAGTVVGGKLTRFTCCDQASDAGVPAANAGQIVLICLFGVAYKGTNPGTAIKSIIAPPPMASTITQALGLYFPQPGAVGEVDFRYPVEDVRRYGAILDGVTDGSVALANAAASCPRVVIRGPLRINVNTVVPRTVMVQVEPGGSIKPNAGVTVTINGLVPQDGLHRYFDLSLGGLVVLSSASSPHFRPEWWGATDYAITAADSDAALRACYAACKTASVKMQLAVAQYGFTASCILDGAVSIHGSQGGSAPAYGSTLLKIGNFVGIRIQRAQLQGNSLRDFSIDSLAGHGDASDNFWFEANNVGGWDIHNVEVRNAGRDNAVFISGNVGEASIHCYSAGRHNLVVDSGNTSGDYALTYPGTSVNGIHWLYIRANGAVTGRGVWFRAGIAHQIGYCAAENNHDFGFESNDSTNGGFVYTENNGPTMAGEKNFRYGANAQWNYFILKNANGLAGVVDDALNDNNTLLDLANGALHMGGRYDIPIAPMARTVAAVGRGIGFKGGAGGANSAGGIGSLSGGDAGAGVANGGDVRLKGGDGSGGGKPGAARIAENGGRVVLGGAAVSDNSSAIEDLRTDGGWYPPKLTTAQRDAVLTWRVGAMIWNTTLAKLQVLETLPAPGGWVSK